MTREEAIEMVELAFDGWEAEHNLGDDWSKEHEARDMAIKALEQESSRDMEEIKEVINCDADAETKCKMISNILNAKPHYFEEPQESEDKE